MSNEVARLVAHFPMPWINPPSNTFFVKVLVTCAPMHIQRNTVLTLLQVLPLPLLQPHHGTTLHHIHPLTSDATTLITTSCILFYFISPFLLLKLSLRSCYHTRSLHGDHCHGARKRDDHTILSVGTQATTPMSHPSLAPTPMAAIAPFAGIQVMFFSFLLFCPFSDQCYRDSLPHAPGPQTPTPPLCVTPQASQVLLPLLPHSRACK